MYRRILVPLDGSPLAEEALAQLSHLAGPETEVLLVRVAEPTAAELPPVAVGPNPPGGGAAIMVPARQIDPSTPTGGHRRREAREYLEAKAEGLRGTVATRRVLVVEDTDPAAAIAGVAADEPADLVVMATHGRSTAARWILGSVAERVLHETRVPLLLVRPTTVR